MEKNVNRNEVSANNVVINDLMAVYEMNSFSADDTKKLRTAMKAAASLNKTIKAMKAADVWPFIAPIMERYNFAAAADFGVKAFKEQVHTSFKKIIETKDGEKKDVICSVRKRFETETVYLCNESGQKLCKEGTPRTLKQAKIDEDGEKIIKDYQLCTIHSWTIDKVIDVLRQSANARQLEYEAAQLAANEKAAEKNEKAA